MEFKLILLCFIVACFITAEAARMPFYRRHLPGRYDNPVVRDPERDDYFVPRDPESDDYLVPRDPERDDFPVPRDPERTWKVTFHFQQQAGKQ